MSDITNIVPPLIVHSRAEQLNDQKNQQRNPPEDKDSHEEQDEIIEAAFEEDDELEISLRALEEKIIQDATQILGYYDDIPSITNEDEPEETSPTIYQQAINQYQKAQTKAPIQQNTYQEKEFPIRIPDNVAPDKLLILERLLEYWDALEKLRAQGVQHMPHYEGKSLYQSFSDFLSNQSAQI